MSGPTRQKVKFIIRRNMGYKFESLDTNVLLRLILREDEDIYSKIKEYINERPDRKFMIDDVAFSETIYVLERLKKFDRKKVTLAIEPFLNGHPFVTNMRIDKILQFYVKHPKLSFNDCYLAFRAEEDGGVPLWTLDQKLAKQATAAKLIA